MKISSQESRSFTPVKQFLRKVTKTLYNEDTIATPLQNLEKSALRGEGISEGEAKIKPKIITPLTSFEKHLRSQHKTSNLKVQIVDLPKQPFGIHRSYNEQSSFKTDHFIDKEEIFNHEREKNLDNLSREFQLFVRRKRQPNKNTKKKRWLSSCENLEVFEMKAGNLVCEKQIQVMDEYEHTKRGVKEEESFNETFRKLKHVNTFLHGKERRESVADVVGRLHEVKVSNSKMNRRMSYHYEGIFSGTSTTPESPTGAYKKKGRKITIEHKY